MASTPVITPNVVGVAPAPITPGADSIVAGPFQQVLLVLRSVSTGTPTITVDDPTSPTPAGTLASPFNADVTLTVSAGQTKVMLLDCNRFRDFTGNINYTTATPGDALVYAIGIP